MAELHNRDELEADFAKRFGKVARRHMREFRNLLGDPPDLDSIPQSFWDKMERESDDVLWPILLLLFGESAEQHGWIGDSMGTSALGWATERAGRLAESWVGATRARLEKGWDRLTNPLRSKESNHEETVEQAREFNRTNRHITPRPSENDEEPEEESGIATIERPTAEKVDELIDSAFGPERVTGTVIDETTRARHAGGESAIEETVGCSQDDEWQNNPHASATGPCKICESLNNLKRRDWPWRYQDGPPSPHFRCCCTVRYARKPLSDAIGDMLDDPDYKSLKAFDPGEKRDEGGKWTKLGTVAAKESAEVLDKIRAGDQSSKNGGDLRPVNREQEHDLVKMPLSALSKEHIQHLRDSTSPERLASYVTQKIDTPVHASVGRKGQWQVNDGGHRTIAAIDRGDTHIMAMIPKGSPIGNVSTSKSFIQIWCEDNGIELEPSRSRLRTMPDCAISNQRTR